MRQTTDHRRNPLVPRPDITHEQGTQTKPDDGSRNML